MRCPTGWRACHPTPRKDEHDRRRAIGPSHSRSNAGLGPGEALLEHGLLGGVGGQLQGEPVGGAGLVRVAELA